MTGAPAKPAEKAGRRVVPHTARWYQRVGAWLIWALLRALTATLRYRWTDRSGFFEGGVLPMNQRNEGERGRGRERERGRLDNASRGEGEKGPVIFCVWHNRLALTMSAYFGYAFKRSRTVGMAAMVSASKDGAFLAAILEAFNVQPVRGSTSRRGPQALLELTSWAERGYDLAITPDGPRGPCYVVQEGVMSLAQVTGLPIIPFSAHIHWKVRPNSWDRFQIPLPFSRCDMFLGPAVRVPREATEAQREELRKELERILKAMAKD